MSYSIRHLSDPTELELVAASKALSTALKDDGFIKMTIGRDPELVVPFVNAVLLAGTIEGEIHVAEDANGTIVGGAVWFGPGAEFCHSEAQQERVLVPLLAQFDDELQAWWNDKFLPEYHGAIDQELGPNKRLRSYHLQLIGIAPNHPSQQLATRMIRAVLEKAQKHGYDSLVEATNIIHLGFVDRGQKEFLGVNGKDKASMWVMVNPAPPRNDPGTSYTT
ncbi:N-acetyltransferase domain-containing protein [Pleurotus pulmonarius]